MFEIDDEVVLVIQQWVQKAENDLKNAAHTLKLGADGPMDTACFHAQQCVEKYLKALLVLHDIEFARVHHIGDLINRLPARLRPDLTPEEQERLTDYAVSTRYPGDYERVSLAEARRAVQVARRVRKQLRRHLPIAGLKPL